MPNVNVEVNIADCLCRFQAVLNKEENMQQKIHDIIMALKAECVLSETENKITGDVLNAFLSMSFVLKNRSEEIDKFIDYH